MIYYLKRKQLNTEKYDACITSAVNSRIYAYSWYLDIVADNWDALVLNDYEAVMPLPWKEKYFIKYIYPPAWTQQLGVFSKLELDAQLVKCFIDIIPRKFKKITIQFNSGNDLSLFKTEKRINHVLPLANSYEDIYEGYRKDRKDRLRQVKPKKMILQKIKIENLIEVSKTNYSYLKIKEKDYTRIKALSVFSESNSKGFVIGVFSNNNLFLGGVFFLKDKSRITYLFSVTTELGKKEQAMTTILNEVINQNSSSNLKLDFEGSMIEGVSEFYRGFGAQSENYFYFQDSFLL